MRGLIAIALLSLAQLGLLLPVQAQEKAPRVAPQISYQSPIVYYPANYVYYPYSVPNYAASFVTRDGGYVATANFPGYPNDPRQYGSTAMVFDPASSSYYVVNPLTNRWYGPYHANVPR
jgi:hypothetical protein